MECSGAETAYCYLVKKQIIMTSVSHSLSTGVTQWKPGQISYTCEVYIIGEEQEKMDFLFFNYSRKRQLPPPSLLTRREIFALWRQNEKDPGSLLQPFWI